jgi:VWFA-related protein
MKYFVPVLIAGALIAAAAIVQEQQQTSAPIAPPTTVIKTETRLVLVDAVITDKKGAYVHDLTQKDFKVWEDNKEQAIKSFSFEADPNGPNKDQKRYLVLFFDNSNMALPDQQRAREAAGKFVDSNAGPNHLIAIADYSGSLKIVQNFTEDADRLHQVVKDTKLAMGPTLAGPGSGGLGRAGYEFGLRNSLGALRNLAHNLGDVSGRKSLVFFTSGFRLNAEMQSELTATISECNRANVAVYPVDVRGLVADPLGNPGANPSGLPGGRGGRGGGQVELRRPAPRLYGGATIVMAAFSPDPQRGGGTTGGTTGGGTSGGGATGGGATGGATGGAAGGGGGRAGGAGGSPAGGFGGNPGGGSRTGAPGSPGSTGVARNPGNTGAAGIGGGGGNPNNMYNMNGRYNPFGAGRSIVPTIPPFAGEGQSALYQLAEGTGGFVILNTNDLLGGLEKIGKEQNEYYLIGYSPSDTPEGSCHTLKVRVDKGYSVRHRTGYCNVKQVDLLAGKPAEKDLENRVAGTQPGTVSAPLQAPYFFTGPNTARVYVAMEIPSTSVKFAKVKGKEHAEINILAIAYKPDGQVGARFSDTVKLDMEDKKQMEEFTKKPLHYDNQFDIASGQYTLKVAFSSGGEAFGKLEKPLNIDKYDAGQFALSSVALSKDLRRVTEADANLDAILLEGRNPLIASSMQITPTGVDQFKKTETAAVYMEIYEPLNMGEKVPQIGVDMRILDRATGEVKVDSKVVEMTKEAHQGNPMVPIGLLLPVKNLAPGAYKGEFIAIDGAGKQALRTIDFNVVE